ncbi:Uncharacterised protein [Salmonella enterica subsp. enterica]|uniref:Uncharacterized protein n=1 Tax=Salmonella enterica I TaxID=59201 RepID=A0A3S5DCT7_SALET|nr:Uncharacterised protein [Salmonella enterica subsp. enterica]
MVNVRQPRDIAQVLLSVLFFSHHDCGLFVDSTAFYFGVCMGRYDCYRDLARFAEITKNIVGAAARLPYWS